MRLQPLLRHLSLGPTTTFENLSFSPVVGPSAIRDDLLLPDEALETGYFSVRECGRIEVLVVENRLGMNVFIPSGATFEAETQNRAAVFPVIVQARSREVPILVRCIEKGQPLRRGHRFLTSQAILLASARTGDVVQVDVWSTIGSTMSRWGVANVTSDYSTALRATALEDYLRAIGAPAPGQRGYVAAVRDRDGLSLYADILGSSELYARLHEKLWKSVAAVARAGSRRGECAPRSRQELGAFVLDAGRQELEERPLVPGLLGTVCLSPVSDRTVVSALVYRGMPVQVSIRSEPDRERSWHGREDPLVFRHPRMDGETRF